MGGALQLEFFTSNGFQRQRCRACGSHFWALEKQPLCGDAPCVEYSFLGAPLFDQPFGLAEMREAFLAFFEVRGHKRVERAPVVARWRDDIYLTIASIAVFQPHVTSGLARPPANPLAISQPCIRLNDLESVGRSGRHLTTFEMMAHHAFNSDDEDIYWQDRTVELCHELYTGLGVPAAALTYKENPWVGGGNGGEALEVLAGGLELATLVFMDLVDDPQGDIQLKGGRFRRMSRAIVDTGYGLERMVWASQGTGTIYEAVFPAAVELLTREAGLAGKLDEAGALIAENARACGVLSIDYGADLTSLREQVLGRLRDAGHELTLAELRSTIEPLEKAFAVADHSRTLAFMFGDGVVPSNVRAGYLARMVLRRTLLLLRDLGIPNALPQVVGQHIDELAPTYPELATQRDHVLELVALESERFDTTLERGRRTVQRTLAAGNIGAERLVELYDSQGLPPAVVAEFAAEQGASVEVPDGFMALVAERHAAAEKPVAKVAAEQLPPTELAFYDDMGAREFDASVTWANGGAVALDRTLFYPEGGGQPADAGALRWEGGEARVTDVRKRGDAVLHTLDGDAPPVGAAVRGAVDSARRDALSQHHTATHVIGAAARRTLGPHVWQAGARKATDSARLDITHHQRLDHAAVAALEREANRIVHDDHPVEAGFMTREEADALHGATLYQGGAPNYRDVRVVEIPGIDAQACAGTHVPRTGALQAIKVLRTERIQDGVERIEFSAGAAAVAAAQAERELLEQAAAALGVPLEQVADAAGKLMDERKELRSRVAALEKERAEGRAGELAAERIGSVDLYINDCGDAPLAEMQELARRLSTGGDALVLLATRAGGKGHVMAARGGKVTVDCGALAGAAAKAAGGGGGGAPTHAQGAVPADRTGKALEALATAARKALAE